MNHKFRQINTNSSVSKLAAQISLLIAVLASAVFVWRYAARLSSPYAPLLAIVIALCYAALAYWASSGRYLFSSRQLAVAASLWGIAAAMATYMTPIQELGVDRWSMIHIFWGTAFAGDYPYGVADPNTGCNPGGLPFYFVLTLPAYLLNAYWLPAVAGLLIWVYYSGVRWSFDSARIATTLILCSFLCFWEIPCRSTLFFNAVVFFLWFTSLRGFDRRDVRWTIVSGIIGGLVLSTRAVLGLAVVIFVIQQLRGGAKLGRLALWCVTIAATAALTFVPLIAIWGWDSFLSINPLTIQSEAFIEGPWLVTLLILNVVPGLFAKNFDRVISLSGFYLSFVLFFNVILAFVRHPSGIAYDLQRHDMSYMLLAMPFLFYTIQQWLTERK